MEWKCGPSTATWTDSSIANLKHSLYSMYHIPLFSFYILYLICSWQLDDPLRSGMKMLVCY